MANTETKPGSPQIICWLCKKPIKPHKVKYQGGQFTHPSHKKCLMSIDMRKVR